MSLWEDVPTAPPDAILGLNEAFKKDKNPKKVNLGVGAYRTEEGKPYVLPVVRKMEERLAADSSANHEYIPQDGYREFVEASARLILGDDASALAEERVASVQSLSGTGALRLGFAFVREFLNPDTAVYLPEPTWSNHKNVVVHAQLPTARSYRYYDNGLRGLDINGLLADLNDAPPRSLIVLHACCHNPTGCDPTMEEWKQIESVVRNRRLVPFFDCAYQGFGSGSLSTDAAAVRMFAAGGGDMIIGCSFAKNMGLYGERVGALHFVCATPKPVTSVMSQLKKLVRAMYSSPPLHGARVAAMVLKDTEAFAEWEGELMVMSGRIKEMRTSLKSEIESLGTPGNWDHICTQIGMFSFTGLSADDVDYIREKHAIYMTRNGRISMAGLTRANIKYVAQAIYDAVTRTRTHSNL